VKLFALIVCHFTEMTSLDQHMLMNMQKVERTGDKVKRSDNIVAGLLTWLPVRFDLDKVLIFVETCFDIRLCRQCVPDLNVCIDSNVTVV